MRRRSSSGSREVLALLTGLSLFLSAVESAIPRPVPFFRIGLSNLPLLLALDVLPVGTMFLLGAAKVISQGLLSGTLFSYVSLFSLGGTAASVLVMLGMRWTLKKRIGFVGISAAGAFASNVVQILLARTFVFGEAAWSMGPILLSVGLVTGALLGLFAQSFSDGPLTRKLAAAVTRDLDRAVPPGPGALTRQNRVALLRFALMTVFLPVFLLCNSLFLETVLFVLFALMAASVGARLHPVRSLATAAAIIAVQLFSPFGAVVAEAGPIVVTLGALKLGAARALSFSGLLFLSRFGVSRDLALPGAAGSFFQEVFAYFDLLMAWDVRSEPRKGFVRRFEAFLLHSFEVTQNTA